MLTGRAEAERVCLAGEGVAQIYFKTDSVMPHLLRHLILHSPDPATSAG